MDEIATASTLFHLFTLDVGLPVSQCIRAPIEYHLGANWPALFSSYITWQGTTRLCSSVRVRRQSNLRYQPVYCRMLNSASEFQQSDEPSKRRLQPQEIDFVSSPVQSSTPVQRWLSETSQDQPWSHLAFRHKKERGDPSATESGVANSNLRSHQFVLRGQSDAQQGLSSATANVGSCQPLGDESLRKVAQNVLEALERDR